MLDYGLVRMDAFIERKDRIMEGLVTATQSLLDSCRSGDLHLIEKRIEDRAHLLVELQRIDESLRGLDTSKDFTWFMQLGHINKLDEEIRDLVNYQKSATLKDLFHEEQVKCHLLQEAQVDPRGMRFELKV